MHLKVKNIIVQMPNWIGDLVMATPILTDLRSTYPKATITAMVLDKIGGILEADVDIDELFLFSKVKGLIRRMKQRSIVRKLREGQYDLGILLTNSLSSAWRFWQGNVGNKTGFCSDGRRFLLDHPIPFPKKRHTQHLVATYKQLLCGIGIPPSSTLPRLFIKKGRLQAVRELLKRFDIPTHAKLIGIHPGAAYGPAKCWLPERFREVAIRLVENDSAHHVLFVGDAFHKNFINKICSGLPKQIVNLAGQTDLSSLIALISTCSAFLSNDSGPMHIADSLNIPLVALFGSTNPVVTGPYRRSQGILQKKVSCSPCFKKVCPTDFLCMKNLTVDLVVARLLDILEQKETVLS